jgi:response regulator RpfG family c-di-GMP phosphodiesterase
MKIRTILCLLVMGVLCANVNAVESRCPLIPMGAITGKPDEQQIQETLESYKAVGVDQFLVYP